MIVKPSAQIALLSFGKGNAGGTAVGAAASLATEIRKPERSCTPCATTGI